MKVTTQTSGTSVYALIADGSLDMACLVTSHKHASDSLRADANDLRRRAERWLRNADLMTRAADHLDAKRKPK